MTLPDAIPVRRVAEDGGLPWSNGASWPVMVIVLVLFLCVALAVWRGLQQRQKAGPGAARLSLSLGGLFGARPGQSLRVVDSARLTQTHTVHEVLWEGQRYLVACAPNNVSLLAAAPAAEPPVVEAFAGGPQP